MKDKVQRITEEAGQLCDEAASGLQAAGSHLHEIGDEYHRVAELSGQAGRIVDQIDLEFKSKTKLSSTDITILFLATAVQCTRQYLLTNDKLRLTAKQGDYLVKPGDKLLSDVGKQVQPSVGNILANHSVPYDATEFYSLEAKETLGKLGLGGSTHRYRTLGHDPVLGWIFGPANIITNALTMYDMQSFLIFQKKILSVYPGTTVRMFTDTKNYVVADPMLLPAAVVRQTIHFGSDYFTKQGLPVPIISTVDNNLAAKMLRQWHIDMWSVTRGATLAALINQLVACIHQLFYNERKDGDPKCYEVRTRKILSYSNILATGSNVIVTAFTQDGTKFDFGGMLVTIYRLVNDYQFIHAVKKDFLKECLYDRVVGTEYDFMKGEI